ncbi:hypothetical protein V8G54_014683 [Vigna mungo]|uniref:Uncharacterized protein n=1 Tax=Vigna mungo TaxID=3915 RepID=A0AAQ3NJT7_VIGMU
MKYRMIDCSCLEDQGTPSLLFGWHSIGSVTYLHHLIVFLNFPSQKRENIEKLEILKNCHSILNLRRIFSFFFFKKKVHGLVLTLRALELFSPRALWALLPPPHYFSLHLLNLFYF